MILGFLYLSLADSLTRTSSLLFVSLRLFLSSSSFYVLLISLLHFTLSLPYCVYYSVKTVLRHMPVLKWWRHYITQSQLILLLPHILTAKSGKSYFKIFRVWSDGVIKCSLLLVAFVNAATFFLSHPSLDSLLCWRSTCSVSVRMRVIVDCSIYY